MFTTGGIFFHNCSWFSREILHIILTRTEPLAKSFASAEPQGTLFDVC